jgi:phospholipase D1/2
VLPQQPWTAPIITLPITLEFICRGRRKHTQAFNIPINSGWFGEIQVALGTGASRIESHAIPFAERSWGLPAAFGSAISPLGQLQELVNIRGMPPELSESWAKIKKWLEGSAPRATYPVRANNWVKFYNDASVNADGTPDTQGNTGAFHDLYNAMQAAQHFIFIADWSFHPTVYLKRPPAGPDPNPKRQDRIGTMLINKARGNRFDGTPDQQVNEQNIVIAVHTWFHVGGLAKGMDDPANNDAPETWRQIHRAMFPNTRFPANLLWRATERSGLLRSQHQKFVVMDAPAPQGARREMKVFFGGLDLTKGRFDWPAHPIDDPHHTFKPFDDWYNPEFDGNAAMCRQPWHDIYAQLVGPAAWDFIFEFVGRWSIDVTVGVLSVLGNALGSTDPQKRVWRKFQELLTDNNFIRLFDPPLVRQDRPWTVQAYRSMEKHFWYKPGLQGDRSQAAPNFLQWGLHKDYEKSIHKAYLQAIQRAENFMYIETQYLIAGEYCNKEVDVKAQKRNHIPKAIVNRIVEKHRNGDNFHVYILLPMFPEGAPDATKLVPVRYFQWQTIMGMKNELVQRLQALGNNGKTWKDYLSFYFLGNRTAAPQNIPLTTTTRQGRVRASQRYMIYVHSKMMIVDDKWIIIGSANLNERSMSGSMDSEVCVGMWASPGREVTSFVAISRFREKLWREHLGDQFIDDNPQGFDIIHPEWPGTYNRVQTAALNNLNDFVNRQTSQSNQNPNSINHLMLWNLDAAGFAEDLIPDHGDLGILERLKDDWRVQPHRRGAAGAGPNDLFL